MKLKTRPVKGMIPRSHMAFVPTTIVITRWEAFLRTKLWVCGSIRVTLT